VDNFRTLVNFELKLDPTNLFLGNNGSGKSSVFDVLRRLQGFISGETRLAEAFPSSDFTSWSKGGSNTQTFELDLETEAALFTYRLVIEFAGDWGKSKVKEEKLKAGDTELFLSRDGEARIFKDDGQLGTVLQFDWTQSGVGLLQERRENKKLAMFKAHIQNVIVVRPTPALMLSESRDEENCLSLHMENFAAWYRYLTLENMSAIQQMNGELPESMPGFENLNSMLAGERRILKANFQTADGKTHTYSFAHISDGQKMLVAIYALLLGTKGKNACLFIDEPDNCISIREIQPWLRLFVDSCGKGQDWEQVVLISHHPEVIDYSSLGIPVWFDREPESHTRTGRIKQQQGGVGDPALSLSQSIARGLVQ